MDPLAPTTPMAKPRYICSRCTIEYARFSLEHLRSFEGRELSTEQQIGAMKESTDAADAHMREWVSRSGRREDV